MNDHQAFNKLMKELDFPKDLRRGAWEIMRAQGFEAGKAHVESVLAEIAEREKPVSLLPRHRSYRAWGINHIEQGAIDQMTMAMRLPVTVAGALMPDAHQGYGLPIGGVLATDNVVIPYGVGVDIACRMRLSVYPVAYDSLDENDKQALIDYLREETIFGAGEDGMRKAGDVVDHPVLSPEKWAATPFLKSLLPTARRQIGTSGGGNHFVEWCEITFIDANHAPYPIEAGRGYLALMSHSGSRGVGYQICTRYTAIAKSQCRMPEGAENFAWLELGTGEGDEYWHAMNLAGEFAAANHEVIHRCLSERLGILPRLVVENHHNFAWLEEWRGRKVVVHRKGATPAGLGVRGIIPGSMGDAGYLVEGLGNVESINSASHGAGRAMSRRQAIKTLGARDVLNYLKERGVKMLGGGLDEAPQAYKPIETVMKAQDDLVRPLARIQPRIVMMAQDAAED